MTRSAPNPTAVLLVEDNAGDARLLREALSEDTGFPYQLVTVERVAAAVEVLGQAPVDVVLLDLTLPDASGTAGLQRLHAAHPLVPIVVLTGMSDAALAIEAVQAGAQDYLVKGDASPRLITRAIRHAIERSRSEEAALTLAREQTAHAASMAERTRLHALLLQAPTAIAVVRGPELTFELASSRYLQLVGRTQVVGKTVHELFPEVSDQGVEDLLRSVMTTGVSYVGKEVVRKLDRRGTGVLDELICDFVYEPVRGPDGAIESVMIVATEVTEQVLARQRTEQARRDAERSEQRFQLLTEAIPQIVWSMAPDISEAYLSPRWYEYTGQPREQPLMDKLAGAVHPADFPLCCEVWAAATRDRAPWQMEYRLRRHDGEYRWHLGRSVPHFEADGSILRWYGTATDINDQRTAIRSRDDLLATVSHDLRGPLASITMAVEVLRMIGVADGSRQLGAIERSAIRMEQLLRDLLDMASIESGHLSVEPAPCVVGAIVEEAVESIKSQAAAKGLELDTELTAPSIPIHCDRGRVLQVFSNLLGNAVKFTPAKGRISIRAGSRDDRFVEFAISDTGPGIDADQLPFIFDRFWQAKATAKAGTGLGLAICKGIIQQHGGSIWAESQLGAGTTFYFTLPIAAPGALTAR